MTVGLSETRRALHLREIGATLALLFSRRWWWKTLFVLLAMAFMVGLGFWQLDRLEQRRALNQQRRAALAAAPLELTGAPLPSSPLELRDRRAVALGELDHARQVAIRNQNLDGQPGVHLVTPLLLAGSEKAVLVNRGWIPVSEADPTTWRMFDLQLDRPPGGHPEANPAAGRTARSPPIHRIPFPAGFGLTSKPSARRCRMNCCRWSCSCFPKTPMTQRICRSQLSRLSLFEEGNHFSYALQWFGFAITAAVVYIAVARRAT